MKYAFGEFHLSHSPNIRLYRAYTNKNQTKYNVFVECDVVHSITQRIHLLDGISVVVGQCWVGGHDIFRRALLTNSQTINIDN